MHKIGNIVKIYRYPLTKKELEGEAYLFHKLKDTYNLEQWKVRFVKDDPIAPCWRRWIKKE